METDATTDANQREDREPEPVGALRRALPERAARRVALAGMPPIPVPAGVVGPVATLGTLFYLGVVLLATGRVTFLP